MKNSVNIELGLNKKVKRAYGIDEIALVPGERTLDYDLTDPSWLIGDLKREVPIIAIIGTSLFKSPINQEGSVKS